MIHTLKNIFKKKNLSPIIIVSLLASIGYFVVHLILVHTLELETYGKVATIGSLIALLSVICIHGVRKRMNTKYHESVHPVLLSLLTGSWAWAYIASHSPKQESHQYSKQMLPFILSTIAIVCLQNLDLLFVSLRFSAEDTGLYAGWLLFSKAIVLICSPLIGLGYLYFSDRQHEIRHQIAMIVSLVIFFLMGVLTNVVYGGYARPLIEAVLGYDYLPIFPYLEWASLYGTLTALIAFLSFYYLAKGQKIGIIVFGCVFVYIAALILLTTTIIDVVYINLIFCIGIIGIYLLKYFWERLRFLLS